MMKDRILQRSGKSPKPSKAHERARWFTLANPQLVRIVTIVGEHISRAAGPGASSGWVPMVGAVLLIPIHANIQT